MACLTDGDAARRGSLACRQLPLAVCELHQFAAKAQGCPHGALEPSGCLALAGHRHTSCTSWVRDRSRCRRNGRSVEGKKPVRPTDERQCLRRD
jgi:hypothetical protein